MVVVVTTRERRLRERGASAGYTSLAHESLIARPLRRAYMGERAHYYFTLTFHLLHLLHITGMSKYKKLYCFFFSRILS